MAATPSPDRLPSPPGSHPRFPGSLCSAPGAQGLRSAHQAAILRQQHYENSRVRFSTRTARSATPSSHGAVWRKRLRAWRRSALASSLTCCRRKPHERRHPLSPTAAASMTRHAAFLVGRSSSGGVVSRKMAKLAQLLAEAQAKLGSGALSESDDQISSMRAL